MRHLLEARHARVRTAVRGRLVMTGRLHWSGMVADGRLGGWEAVNGGRFTSGPSLTANVPIG